MVFDSNFVDLISNFEKIDCITTIYSIGRIAYEHCRFDRSIEENIKENYGETHKVVFILTWATIISELYRIAN